MKWLPFHTQYTCNLRFEILGVLNIPIICNVFWGLLRVISQTKWDGWSIFYTLVRLYIDGVLINEGNQNLTKQWIRTWLLIMCAVQSKTNSSYELVLILLKCCKFNSAYNWVCIYYPVYNLILWCGLNYWFVVLVLFFFFFFEYLLDFNHIVWFIINSSWQDEFKKQTIRAETKKAVH